MALIDTNEVNKEHERRKRMKYMINQNRIQYTIRIPKHIHEKFKAKLFKDKKIMLDFFMDMILKYIEK